MLVTVIIPIYNERNLIPLVLEKVRRADLGQCFLEIIAVDDGSTDGTGKYLDEAASVNRLKVLHNETNKGKGASIMAALARAAGEIVIIQDADLEYSPSDYRAIIKGFEDGGVMAVYGSRFLKKPWPSGMNPVYWFANRLFTITANLLFGGGITDEGTAYKAFRRGVLESLDVKARRFEFCPEVTAKLLKKGMRIAEVPVTYRARGKAEGKKPGFKDGIQVLWTLVKYRFLS